MNSNRQQRGSYRPLANSETETVNDEQQTGNIKWMIIWRGTNAVMTIFFCLAGFVQINDPDPYIWIPIYLVPAMLSFALVIYPSLADNGIWRVLCILHIGVCLSGITYLAVIMAEVMTGNTTELLEHEEGREMAGLLIIVLWLSACRFTTLGSSDPKHGLMNGLMLLTAILACFPLVFWGLCFVDDIAKHLSHCKDMFPGILG